MRESTYEERKTQEQIILDRLREAQGWLDGMSFLRNVPPITQFHARIFGLQRKGHKIEGRFIEGRGWKEYKLIEDLVQRKLI